MSTIPLNQIPVPDLPGLLAFVRVAELGSFVRAAETLGLSKAAVSKQVSGLEQRLGARLLHRTTRRLSLTEAGQLYLRHAQVAFAEARAAEDAVTDGGDVPRGRLRVAIPMTFGIMHVAPYVGAFLTCYPQVDVDLRLADGPQDLIGQGDDLGIRLGQLESSSLIARTIAHSPIYLCASPAYLEQHGQPQRPDELSQHDCLHFSLASAGRTWEFRAGEETLRIALPARLDANNMLALKMAALAGAGIARIPAFVTAEELHDGRLQRVLPQWSLPGVDVHALMPARQHVPAKVRAFVEYLRQAWATQTDWGTAARPGG
jgi:DNA-binding transcriptional LysR family regulator